jgi:PAS domain S-box-containing protein
MNKTQSEPSAQGSSDRSPPVRVDAPPTSSVSGERRRAFDMAVIGMGILALDGRWLSANAALAALVGRDVQEVLALSLEALTHPDDRADDAREIARLLHGDIAVSERDKRMLQRSGEPVWVRQQVTVSYDNGGRPLHLLWQGQDVTPQVRAEAAQRVSDANFRALIERAPEMTIVHRGGRILYVNPATVAALRYDDPAELLGRDLGDLVLPEERVALAARVETMMSTGEPAPLSEIRLLCRTGETIAAELVGVPVVFDGEPAVASMARDVTARKEMQAHLVQTDRLVALGTLAAGVAHEINNPLTYVMRNLELVAGLMRARADEHRKGAVVSGAAVADMLDELASTMKVALDGADRVAHTVRDLTTFARGESDRRSLLDVRAVLDPVLRLVNNEIRQRARVVRDLGDVPLVEANKAQLGQVFVNLLLNAAQAIPEGSAEAHEIGVATFTDEAGRAAIEVRDTGSGIPEDLVGRIFEPFFTTKPMDLGTGLGLSICHGIVSALGGEITVRSAPGAGSVFRVSIPAASVSRQRAAPGSPLPPPWTPGARKVRILIVDDEPLIGRSLARALDEHEVRAVVRARDALDAVLAGEVFDVILCDLLMPGMTGMDLHDALTSAAPDQARRMVFMTGGAFTARASAFLERVPNARVEKPLDMPRLRAIVEETAGRKSSA